MFDGETTKIRKIEFDADVNGPVRFDTSAGFTFVLPRKDFFAAFDHDWPAELTPGTTLRVWTLQGSRLAGVEYLKPISNQWIAVWFVGNHFDTKEEAERKLNEYVKFIEDEGTKIAELIDKGADLKMIHDALSDGHTGNTMGMAMSKGIAEAKDRVNAEKIKDAFNDMFGVKPGEKGVVNPAIMNIKDDKDV